MVPESDKRGAAAAKLLDDYELSIQAMLSGARSSNVNDDLIKRVMDCRAAVLAAMTADPVDPSGAKLENMGPAGNPANNDSSTNPHHVEKPSRVERAVATPRKDGWQSGKPISIAKGPTHPLGHAGAADLEPARPPRDGAER